jgi:Protein of unknown function DUF262
VTTLEEQIAVGRREIFTDAYSMSIGEITNLYRDSEIDVHPEFQRVYRWTDLQKTRLVESILLGIPLPSLFVAQAETGAWDVVDGVQRLSTILQFQGVLKDDNGQLLEPLTLQATKNLPALQGKRWEDSDPAASLTGAQRLDFKRAKLDLKIIKRESTAASKYDLFQRLNSYGSPATPQEVRSCLLVSINRDFYEWLRELADNREFTACVSLSERLLSEQYQLELALRFLIFRKLPENRIARMGNLGDFLTDEAARMAASDTYDRHTEGEAFRKTFQLLAGSGEEDVFRRWNNVKKRFEGAFLNTPFEVIGMGLGFHVDEYETPEDTDAISRTKELWSNPQFTTGFATGLRADARLQKTIPLGRKLFVRR